MMYTVTKELIDLDTYLTIKINHLLRNPWMDKLMWEFSENWFIILVLLSGIIVLLKYYKFKKMILQTGVIVISVGLIDLIVSRLFKPNFARLRPSHEPEIKNLMITINDYVGGTYGFVSGHAATNAVAIGLLILFLRQKTAYVYFYLVWVILVSYSRIYLGVHYFGDVCCGILFGLIMSYIFFRIVTKVSIFRFEKYE